MGGGGDTTTVQKSDPWPGQQPYLLDLFARAQKQLNSSNPNYFAGSTVAPQSDATTQAQQQLLAYSRGGAQQTANAAQGALNFNLTDARSVESNPYLQQAINAAITPVQRRLTEAGGTIYNIGDQSMAAGQYGGSRQGVAEGIALSRFGEDAGNIAATMANRGYETGLDASTKALALTPSTMAAGTLPAQYSDTVGQQERGFEQEMINAAIERWNFDQNKDSQKLANYQNIVSGGFGGSSTGSVSGGGTSPVMGMAGGAMAGYSMATMLGGAANGAAWGPWGAAAGALIGLFGSM